MGQPHRRLSHCHGYLGYVGKLHAYHFKSCAHADPISFTSGFGATQGVFREYYFKTPPFDGNQLVASTGLLVVVSNNYL